jgi:hypothetical protein
LSAGTQTLSVTFTPSDTTDYGSASSTNVSLVVSPATLTVTASNASRPYGATNPVFSGTIAGLQNNDNITATYSTTATTNSSAGTYAITPHLVDPNNRHTNYTVTLVNGTLTVTAPSSPPVIQSVTQSGGSLTFTWSAISNQMYQIQSTTNLILTNWTTLAGTNAATNPTMTISEPIGSNSQQFYRVVLLP